MHHVAIPPNTPILPSAMSVLMHILANAVGRRSLTCRQLLQRRVSSSSTDAHPVHHMSPQACDSSNLCEPSCTPNVLFPYDTLLFYLPLLNLFFFCPGNFLCSFDKALANCVCMSLFLPSLLCPHLFVFIPSGIMLFKELCLIILPSYLIVLNLLLTEETH